MEMNGIAHIQLSVNDAARCIPFWERLRHFFEMKTLIKNAQMVSCVGSRTGILVRESAPEHRATRFEQDRAGLHHLCFRARERAHVDEVHDFVGRDSARAFPGRGHLEPAKAG